VLDVMGGILDMYTVVYFVMSVQGLSND
jgi:hypothetical protein